MSLDELQNIERVKQNLWTVVQFQKLIEEQMETIKNEVKTAQADTQYWDITAKYSKYVKLKPRNIQDILTRYPIQDYPQVYNVSLSKEAQHIITDEELFDTVEITSVRIELPL